MTTEHSVWSPDGGGPLYRRVQDVLDCDDEAATVEEAADAWRREEKRLPPSNGGRERFRDALIAGVADGWIAVHPPIKVGGTWMIEILR